MTTKPRILVTAAAGKTGASITRQLLEKGYPVNALVRRQDRRAEALAETITRRYVASNAMARRSFANKLRALGEFLQLLLARTPNLEAYERSQNHPLLRESKYGLDFEPWLKPHSDAGAYGLSSDFNAGHLQFREELGHEVGRPSNRQAVA